MTRKEMIEYASKDCKSTLGNAVLLFFVGMISSAFIWIWYSGDLAIKVFITSFICYIISASLYNIAMGVIAEEVDKIIAGKASRSKNKSKFQIRMEEFQESKNRI